MTALSEANVRVAALEALQDLVKADLAAAREAAFGLMLKNRGAMKWAVTLPGHAEVCAHATLVAPKASSSLTMEPGAFLEWVRANHKNAIVEAVREDFRREFVTGLKDEDGKVVTKDGEVLPFATITKIPAGKPKTFRFAFVDGGRKAVVEAWRAGDLDQYDPAMPPDPAPSIADLDDFVGLEPDSCRVVRPRPNGPGELL